MDAQSLILLIDKYLANQCTPQESAVVEEWYQGFDQRENYLNLLSQEKVDLLGQKMLAQIHRRLDSADAPAAEFSVVDIRHSKTAAFYISRAAAVAGIVLCVALAAYLLMQKPQKKYETAYGEQNSISLPDGSKVVLNGHSTLRSNGEWAASGSREVWLDGEAFFSVKHTRDHQRFLVHTTDGLTIEVLGTSFNVKKRGQETQVVLKEGSIRLSIPREGSLDTILMRPGDMVEVSGAAKQLIRSVVQPEKYVSWQNARMVFSDTPLRDIVKMLQEVYGYEVNITDVTVMDMRFTGSVPNDSVETLLDALRETLSCTIELKSNQLTISKK